MWYAGFFVVQSVYDDFGRTKDLVASAITRLHDLDHNIVGLRVHELIRQIALCL
jgi:hypothetical protein